MQVQMRHISPAFLGSPTVYSCGLFRFPQRCRLPTLQLVVVISFGTTVHPARMASRTMVLIPSDENNIIQSGPVFPGTFVQQSGAQYIQYGGQQLGTSHSAPQQIPSALGKLFHVETKTLGAIQIMIGLIHIGFGALSYPLIAFNYLPIAGLGGYTFWGGLFFIASGSLCVASVKNPNRCLVRCCVEMNITSAVISSFGIILYISELVLNSVLFDPYRSASLAKSELSKPVGTGIAVLLLMFSSLQFCITVTLTHFACMATCYDSDRETTTALVSNEPIGSSMMDSPGSNLPPPPDSASKAE